MKSVRVFLWISVVSCFALLGCARPSGLGVAGRYIDGKDELIKNRGSDLTKAIALLESVAREDPLYKDSLTLLMRAYYERGRYDDALQMAQRSLAVNSKDEITWIALGLTQLRLGYDDAGLKSLKAGITLLSKASKPGYRGISFWDRQGLVRRAVSRTALITMKGVSEKDDIIRSAEHLLSTVDQEEWTGRIEQEEEQRAG